jgi:hypothetical protein
MARAVGLVTQRQKRDSRGTPLAGLFVRGAMRRTELPRRFSMAKKARLQGNAGNYRIRGTIWDLGSFAYRAYVHLVPVAFRPDLPRSVLSADGMTLQEVLGAARARVKPTIGTPVERLELVPKTVGTPRPTPSIQRRYDNGSLLDASSSDGLGSTSS